MSLLDRLKGLFSSSRRPAAPSPAITRAPASAPAQAPILTPSQPTTSPTSGRILSLRGQDIETLDGPVAADISIDLEGCLRLTTLPDGIMTGTLNLGSCIALEQLPSGLSVAFLDLADCTALRALPSDLRLRGGRLNLRNCAMLTELPSDLGEVAQLDISGCLNLRSLPDGLTVTSWIDIGGSGVDSLPERFDDVGIRWNRVAIPRRVAFAPDTLTHAEILAERNAEVRRVMIERFGYERLIAAAGAEELDRDRDAGGERRLLRIEMADDEPLVCVSVRCPSTDHHFVLRVPPHMTSCHQAIAWTAGFDDPADYRPAVET